MKKYYAIVEHRHDVLVIGAGGAGLRAAIGVAESGLSVACISKLFPIHSHTVVVQEGINAALDNMDDWQQHMHDTVKASDGLGDQDAIEYMCKNAMQAVVELEHYGVPFSRTDEGKIYQTTFDGAAQRACVAGNLTGHAILHTLYQQALKHKVSFFTEYFVLDLIMNNDGRCLGVIAWNLEDGTLHRFHSQITILATGGYGKTYMFSTASHSCTGDGNAMCLRAGLPLADMEFVQFQSSAAHYTMGGIPTNSHGEVITRKSRDANHIVLGLMAIGECACVSVHGANRLSSNSLLDAIVFGKAAALHCKKLILEEGMPHALPKHAGEHAVARLNHVLFAQGNLTSAEIRINMQQIMQKYASTLREQSALDEGVMLIEEAYRNFANLKIKDRGLIWNSEVVEALELQNLLQQSVVTLHSARLRKESRGSHRRKDYPERDDKNWLKHTLMWFNEYTGKVRVDYKPVRMHNLTYAKDICYQH